jgi:HK97 gp10 family phage protein
MSITIKDHSKEFSQAALQQVGVALTESAIAMEGESIIRCPVDTGHLRGSINFRTHDAGDDKTDGLSGHPAIGTAVIGTNVEYAPYVEYGTRYQKAQPFLTQGMMAAVPKISEIFRRRMGEVAIGRS